MLVAMFKVLLPICLLALARGQVSSSADQEKSASDKAFDMTQGLYITIRNIAFPEAKISDDKKVGSRFLLIMPGKVLNYGDYFPGKDYINFVNNPNVVQREAIVPPHVMEKWFDLADVIPGPNPMNAADSGKSLANVYKSILYNIKPGGLDTKTQSDQGGFAQSVAALNALVPDPENTTESIPRLALYERYRDLYNNRKLEMEDIIESHRRNLSAVEYELWFQRHYPALQAKVESTYTRWVIFGDKETVEYNVAVIDTGSAGQALEEARIALRASGVTSLDRTRKIYPVSFEPSNWYRYLLPTLQKPSRDQLQVILGKIRSKINAVDIMVNSLENKASEIDGNVGTLLTTYNSSQSTSDGKTEAYMQHQIACLVTDDADVDATKTKIDNYDTSKDEALTALTAESASSFNYEFANYFHSSGAEFKNNLLQQKRTLQDEYTRVEGLLTDSSAFEEQLLSSSQLEIADLTNEKKDDEWFQFEYSSKQFRKSTAEGPSLSVTSQMHGAFQYFALAAGIFRPKPTFSEQLSSSEMTVKGELLRVTIKRPWFKPGLFDDPDLTYTKIQNEGVTAYVAPGDEMTETAFYETLIKDDIRYLLPEYTTSFLLARNVELDFKGVDSSTVMSSLSIFSHSGVDANFLFFHASHSATSSNQASSVETKKTADGMKIKIPGAQLIGYYTKKLPRFPPH